MCGCRLWHFVVRFRLDRVNQIGKLDGILNKKNWNVIANEVEDTFIRIKLDCKSSGIACKICGTSRARYRRKSDKHRSYFPGIAQETCFRILGHGFVNPEMAMSCCSSCVYHSFWNSFVIEVGNLFAKDEVFQKRRPA